MDERQAARQKLKDAMTNYDMAYTMYENFQMELPEMIKRLEEIRSTVTTRKNLCNKQYWNYDELYKKLASAQPTPDDRAILDRISAVNAGLSKDDFRIDKVSIFIQIIKQLLAPTFLTTDIPLSGVDQASVPTPLPVAAADFESVDETQVAAVLEDLKTFPATFFPSASGLYLRLPCNELVSRIVNVSMLSHKVSPSRLSFLATWPGKCVYCQVPRPAKELLMQRCGCMYCGKCWLRALNEDKLIEKDPNWRGSSVFECLEHRRAVSSSWIPPSLAALGELRAIEKWKQLLKMSIGEIEL